MKVKDLVEYLKKLEQEKYILVATYYYSDREGFAHFDVKNLPLVLKEATSSLFYDYGYGEVYLFDQRGV